MERVNEKPPRWTPLFGRLPADKRLRVMAAAKSAFARDGFAGANVNLIAEAAGISVGALYKYFRTKEDVFLALIEESHEMLESIVDGILSRHARFFDRVRAILEAAVEAASADPEMVSIYIACTTHDAASLAARLSSSIESVASDRYRAMVSEAIAAGEIRSGLDPAMTAFCLDDLFMMVQFSFGSDYYRQRLRVFSGGDLPPEAETVVAAVEDFIRRSLAPV